MFSVRPLTPEITADLSNTTEGDQNVLLPCNTLSNQSDGLKYSFYFREVGRLENSWIVLINDSSSYVYNVETVKFQSAGYYACNVSVKGYPWSAFVRSNKVLLTGKYETIK